MGIVSMGIIGRRPYPGVRLIEGAGGASIGLTPGYGLVIRSVEHMDGPGLVPARMTNRANRTTHICDFQEIKP